MGVPHGVNCACDDVYMIHKGLQCTVVECGVVAPAAIALAGICATVHVKRPHLQVDLFSAIIPADVLELPWEPGVCQTLPQVFKGSIWHRHPEGRGSHCGLSHLSAAHLQLTCNHIGHMRLLDVVQAERADATAFGPTCVREACC
jgi:hypothetical protein